MFARFGRNVIFNFHTVVLDNYSIFRLDTIKYHYENSKSVTHLHRMIIQTFCNLTLYNGDLLNYFNKSTNTVKKPEQILLTFFVKNRSEHGQTLCCKSDTWLYIIIKLSLFPINWQYNLNWAILDGMMLFLWQLLVHLPLLNLAPVVVYDFRSPTRLNRVFSRGKCRLTRQCSSFHGVSSFTNLINL